MAKLFSFLKRTTSNADGRPATTDDLMPATVTPAGAVVGARPLQNPALGGGYTPDRVASILARAETGDEHGLAEYFALADKVIEREMHTAGVVNGLVLAIAGLPHRAVVKKGDSSKRAQKIADEVADLLAPSSPLRLAAPGIISQGLTHGIGVAAIEYLRTPTAWVPSNFVQKPAHFFTFDRTDGRTPLLRNATAGLAPQALEAGAALVFTPRRNAALQVKNGLAWVLCWSYVIKSIVLADQQLFIQTFGHPLVYGQYKRNATPEDVSLLQRAVSSINSTFRAVFRDDLEIKFQEVARSSTDIYEKVCRYLDESISKVVWASTLTTDAGGSGSYALGKVHAEGKYDVIRSYAQQWSAALQVLVNDYVAINHGPDAPIPLVAVEVEEQEDLVAGSQIVKNLADAGVPLVAAEIRARFGFREPQPGDEVVGGQPSPLEAMQRGLAAAENTRQGQGCPVHSSHAVAPSSVPRDALDDLADLMLSDWQQASDDIDTALSTAAQGATDLADLRLRLVAAVNSYDDTALAAMLTKSRTAARLAGDAGADL